MLKLTSRTLALLAVATLAAPAAPVMGFDGPGVIRLSDQVDAPAPSPETEPLPAPNSYSGHVQGGGVQYVEDGPIEYAGWQSGNGYGRPVSPFQVWMDPDHPGATHSPDYGWSRPVKYPIHRLAVEYQRYWPQNWYGLPGGGIAPTAPQFPQVYMPTDTTQLGYTYQRVPAWRPNPSMLPPMPWPTTWHRRECPPNVSPYAVPPLVNGYPQGYYPYGVVYGAPVESTHGTPPADLPQGEKPGDAGDAPQAPAPAGKAPADLNNSADGRDGSEQVR